MTSTLSERFKTAMQGPPKVSGVALARACKVAPSSVSDWLSGKTKTVESSHLLAAAKFLNVNPDWLTNGIGQRERYSLWKNMVAESPDLPPTDPNLDEARRLLKQLKADQLPETISFIKWQISRQPQPSNGQNLFMA